MGLSYFLAFEKTAELMKWPRDSWSVLLRTQLMGKSLEVYAAMCIDECRNSDLVKRNILDAYEQVAEVYRQEFRQGRKQSSDSYMEFARKNKLKNVLINLMILRLNIGW